MTAGEVLIAWRRQAQRRFSAGARSSAFLSHPAAFTAAEPFATRWLGELRAWHGPCFIAFMSTPSAGLDEKHPFLQSVRNALELRHYSPRTTEAYLAWVRRFVAFHQLRHPRSMGAPEVSAFLSDLASRVGVSATTQNQALAALLFLYADVLKQPLASMEDIVRAKRPMRLPVVMTRAEVDSILAEMQGVWKLMSSLLYGSGLRLLECASLRVKDVDFGGGQLFVRRGKGQKDRATLLPQSLVAPLELHLAKVRARHELDLEDGAGHVALPAALGTKYPCASREWP